MPRCLLEESLLSSMERGGGIPEAPHLEEAVLLSGSEQHSGDSNLHFTPQAISLFSIFPQPLPYILKISDLNLHI